MLMDMVMNHTSDKHEWFLQSSLVEDNPYRDWYVWHDGQGRYVYWQKRFRPTTGNRFSVTQRGVGREDVRQYYYHKFYIQQPDVNWNNPKVHEAFKDVARFWLKRGVGGFRFDAITTLYEDPSMADEGLVKDKEGNVVINSFGDVQLDGSKTDNQPGLHPVMQEMRAATDKFNLDSVSRGREY